jgi:hypothetical protein
VRELIPELYYSPLMLLNLNRHEFGKKQATEEDVDDVELPPWALGNALLFTHRYREVGLQYLSLIVMVIVSSFSRLLNQTTFPAISQNGLIWSSASSNTTRTLSLAIILSVTRTPSVGLSDS